MRFLILVSLALSSAATAEMARDPGVRTGRAGAGNILAGFSLIESVILLAGRAEFGRTHGVREGLGPVFNGDSCIACHSQPAIGGTSGVVNTQVAIATRGGAHNQIPSFISATGPVRVARFRYRTNANGSLTATRDGGVHSIYSIAGRTDGGTCDQPQDDFAAAAALDNIALRIPTPVYGMGLIEAIPDAAILNSFASTATARAALGIAGHPNRSGNDGTIARFGWKAQNKSAEMFAGEAFNVEMGVTNDLFPQERATRLACLSNRVPEDHVTLQAIIKLRAMSAMAKTALWMRALRPPEPLALNASRTSGFTLFRQIGCANCHTPAFSVAGSSQSEIARVGQAMPFSDFMLHKMGPRLADDIIQGQAGPDEFRSAPLWGVGQRIFFLHDGRTSDIQQAILLHASPADSRFPASEANAVIDQYTQLAEPQKQDILNFLRGL